MIFMIKAFSKVGLLLKIVGKVYLKCQIIYISSRVFTAYTTSSRQLPCSPYFEYAS